MATKVDYDGGLTISFHVRDRKKTAAWYEKVLGFKVLYDVAEIGWCELASPVARVNVGLSDVQTITAGAGTTPTFGVRDIDAARKHMEAHDVRFDGATRTIPGMVKLATFFDPDGNTLMLYQDLQKH